MKKTRQLKKLRVTNGGNSISEQEYQNDNNKKDHLLDHFFNHHQFGPKHFKAHRYIYQSNKPNGYVNAKNDP